MDKAVTSSPHDLAQRLYDKNIELENRRRKSAQARVPSDPNAWQQMRENFETIILEDHSFSEKHSIEFALWQLHYRRIEEFRAHYSAASASVSTAPQTRGGPARPDRASKIRVQFKTFLSEATGFYHDLILKIRAKYGLPIGQFYPEQENHKDEKKSMEIKKGLISCHRCLIYLGDLARYKGLYGEGESKSRDYAAASSYYLQAASLWPSSGNPHHQLAILATYSGDELMAVYRYFRSLSAEQPFSTARDNLIVAFEKNRQSYTQTHVDSNGAVKESPVRAKGRGREKADLAAQSKELITDADVDKASAIRQMFKAFRVRFVRLNGILFTHTSLETFEEILPLVTNTLNELLSSGPEEERSFGTDADENGLFIVVLVSILIFTVNNVKGGTEGQSYADIVQNTVLLKNALITFYEITGQLLKRCIQLADPCSSFLLPGVLVCMEWIACHSDVISNDNDEKRSTAQIKFWSYCVSLFNKLLSAGLVAYDDDEDMSCFTDTRRYEEGVNEYQPALWEDFELRGFLPLEPAHAFLDFSRKHSDSKKDKLARVKRILSAGKVVADKITIDHKKVRFDSKLNKFVIGFDNQKDATGSKSYGGIKEMPSNTPAAAMMVKQSKVESHAEVEEDDEVIVFRPNLTDNRTEVISLKESQQEGFENVQNKDVGSFQNTIPQVPLPQSVLPVNSYTHSIGQPINNSYSQSTGQAGQPVKTNYTQSTGQPVVDSYTQSIGQAGQAVNSNYIQTIGQAGQPVNSSYTQSSGQAVQQVSGSYTQSGGEAGQPVNSSYTEGSGQAGQAVNSGYAHVGQQLVNNSYTQSIGHAGQPVDSSYIQSIGQFGQPVSSSYIQSIGQAGQPTNNSYIQSIGQAGQPANNAYAQSVGQSYQFQSPMWSGNRQAVGSVAGGLQGLSFLENGHLGQPELQRDIRVSNATGVREGGVMYTGPTSSLKVSTNRPIRHLGPPPGFSSVRPKQVNELSSALGQNPLNDDYSWLDGYQLQSSIKGGAQPVNLQTNLSSQYMSGSVATSSFPFPGKQVPTVRFEGDKQKNSESAHTHHELLEQQFIPQMDQQGQPVWKGNHFV